MIVHVFCTCGHPLDRHADDGTGMCPMQNGDESECTCTKGVPDLVTIGRNADLDRTDTPTSEP